MNSYWKYSRDNDLKSKEYTDISFMIDKSICHSAKYGYPILYFYDAKYMYEIEWAYNHRDVIIMYIGSDSTQEAIVNEYWTEATRKECAEYMEQYFDFENRDNDYENDEITTAIQCLLDDMICFRHYAEEKQESEV